MLCDKDAVCKTVPASPGLLTMVCIRTFSNFFYVTNAYAIKLPYGECPISNLSPCVSNCKILAFKVRRERGGAGGRGVVQQCFIMHIFTLKQYMILVCPPLYVALAVQPLDSERK